MEKEHRMRRLLMGVVMVAALGVSTESPAAAPKGTDGTGSTTSGGSKLSCFPFLYEYISGGVKSVVIIDAVWMTNPGDAPASVTAVIIGPGESQVQQLTVPPNTLGLLSGPSSFPTLGAVQLTSDQPIRAVILRTTFTVPPGSPPGDPGVPQTSVIDCVAVP
jgi:hypothetical protein